MTAWLDVDCPTCHAKAGHPCKVLKHPWWEAKRPHVARVREANGGAKA